MDGDIDTRTIEIEEGTAGKAFVRTINNAGHTDSEYIDFEVPAMQSETPKSGKPEPATGLRYEIVE